MMLTASSGSGATILFSFWRSDLISCEITQFLVIEAHFVRKGCAGQLAIAIFSQFWRSNLISCEVVRDDLQIAILRRFLAIEIHFVRKGCISWCLVHTAPRLQERNRKEGGGKMAREQERM